MDRELIPLKPHSIQKMQRRGQPLDIPLGTAAWHQFGKNEQPTYEQGDILVGHTDEGSAIGIKDQRHIGIVVKTRSGKGTGLIVPNLILWPGSVVVIDPKGENAILTARRRGNGSAYAKGMGQRVHLLDPFGEVKTSFDSFDDLKASFNPMDILSEAHHKSVDDAARIADSLIDSDSSTADPFWNEAAQGLIKAVMLHIVSSDDFEPAKRNLLTLRDLILEGYVVIRQRPMRFCFVRCARTLPSTERSPKRASALPVRKKIVRACWNLSHKWSAPISISWRVRLCKSL